MVWNIFNLCLKLVRGSPQHGHHQNLPNITCSFCTTRWHWRSRNCSLQSLPGNKLWHPPLPRGRLGEKWCSMECRREPFRALLGLAGQAAAHREGSTRDATGKTFLLNRQSVLHGKSSAAVCGRGEEPAIFSGAILTLPKGTLASCCCSGPSVLPQKSGPQKRICCSLLLFCKSRKLNAFLRAACDAAATQWS